MWALSVLAVSLLPSLIASAQGQRLTVQLTGFIAADWPQAQALVTVLDSGGRPVAGLTEAHFRAQLNGSSVAVVDATEGVDSSLPIAVVLALDVSGSMREGGALEQAKVAALRFLEGLGPQDSVAVLTFHDTVQLVQPFTQDPAAAGGAIEGLVAAGATALYQATAESVRLAAEADSSRRAVVLLSDGLDHGSALSRADALTTVATLGVPVFPIGLGTDIDRDYLQELAAISDGQFAETPSPAGLAQLYQEVGELLRGQYILTLDASGLALATSEAATLRVDATAGEQTAGDERTVCPQALCVALSGLEAGERLEEARALTAQVVSEDPVVSVTFLVDGAAVLELAEPPYQFTFNPASFSKGEHVVTVEAATLTDKVRTSEVALRIGAAPGGISGALLAMGVILIAAVGVVLLFLYLRQRYRGGRERPAAPWRPETPSPASVAEPPRGPRREEGPLPPPAVSQEPLGRLRVVSGPLAGEMFPVGSALVSIGSGHRCLIRLSEPRGDGQEIASEHARVWIRDGQLVMHEVRRLSETGAVGGGWQILTPGDAFTVGPHTFRFELAGDDSPESTGAEIAVDDVPNVLRDRSDRWDAQAVGDAAVPSEASALEAGAASTAGGDAPSDPLPELPEPLL